MLNVDLDGTPILMSGWLNLRKIKMIDLKIMRFRNKMIMDMNKDELLDVVQWLWNENESIKEDKKHQLDFLFGRKND